MVSDFVFRVCKAFFPPIPRPPPKYLYFLEKNDGFNVSLRKHPHHRTLRPPFRAVETLVCVYLSRSVIFAHQSRRR